MEMLKRKSTLMAAVTLIVGMVLGVGISTWTSRSEAAPSKATVSSSNNSDAKPAITHSDEWDPFREMERMREDIDRTIRRATEQFRLDSAMTPVARDSGYSSSLDVRDRGDHFELRAYLPDAETKDVKVKSEGDQAVRVSVSHRKQQKKEENGTQAMFSELGSYEQLVTLPERVNTQDMKVDTKDNEVVITIPKAKAS
jgi:HSP20 family molecular chaperone IbpA